MAAFDTNKRPQLSYSAKLSSNGISFYESNVLLIGPNRWTRPLATALLRSQFDRPTGGLATDPAIEALRRHCCYDPPKRVIHTVESLENRSWNFRMDHIVLVGAARTNSITTSGHPADIHHPRIHQMLHSDYLLLQRATLVQVHEMGGTLHWGTGAASTGSSEETSTTMSSMVPTLNLYLESPNSLATVSRIIWQRVKVGTRQGTSVLPHVSPMLYRT